MWDDGLKPEPRDDQHGLTERRMCGGPHELAALKMRRAVSSGLFRLIERLVGLLDEGRRGRGLGADGGDAQAGGDQAARPGPVCDRAAEAFGDFEGFVFVSRWKENDEFLTSVSCHDVVIAKRRPEGRAETLQDLVAGRVAEGVVVLFELVDIQHDQ